MLKLKIALFSLAICLLVFLPFLFAADETLTITTYYPSPYGSYNQLTTAGNTYLATTTGSVGIGTTSPQDKLHVYSSTYGANIRLTDAGVTNADWSILPSTGGSTPLFRIYNRTTSKEVLAIKPDGNVGIGTTGPTGKLHVVTTSTIPIIFDMGVSNNTNGVQILSSGTEASLRLTNTATNGKDWQILSTGGAAGGGQSKLQFYDSTDNVTGMVINSSGNVGIGTANPLAKLTVMGQIALGAQGAQSETYGYDLYIHANNPTLFMDGIVSSSSPSIILQPRDSGGTTHPFTLAVTSTGNFAMTGGNVGIGTTAPNAKLTVDANGTDDTVTEYIRFSRPGYPTTYYNSIYSGSGSGHNNLRFNLSDLSGNTYTVMTLRDGNVGIGTTPGYKFQVYIDASYEGHVTSTGTWASSSDIRFKKNVSDLKGGLDKILKLRPVRYDSKTEPNSKGQGRHLGFIAQEFEKAVPELVSTDNRGYKAIAYGDLTIVLTKAVQEQQNQIDKQQKKIEEQESRIQKQEKDIEYLKQELIGSTAMLIESNKNLKANTKEIQDLKAEIVSLEKKL